MDTRYWGPSGWRLFHLLLANPSLDRKKAEDFLEVLPYVLPCKWCRYGLSTHMEELPISEAANLEKWMWQIHNKVNRRLKKPEPYPTFASVHEVYADRLEYGCTRTEFPGWEFLFSVLKDHPLQRGNVPIPDHPPLETLKTDAEKNMWNVLGERRFHYWVLFWKRLVDVFPFAEWKEAWTWSSDPETWVNSTKAMGALWKIRCEFESKLELLNKTTYRDLCNDLTFYRSGCATRSNRSRTCRRLRQTRKTQR